MASSETRRRDYKGGFLNSLSGGADFTWFSRPPRGRDGGLLTGVRADNMDVLASSDGDYHIKLHIHNKARNFIWSFSYLVKKVQDTPLAETNAIQMWNNKLRSTRKYLGGWTQHLPGQLKKEVSFIIFD
jgi:hypothetical protein